MNRESRKWLAYLAILLPLQAFLFIEQVAAQCQGLDFTIQNNGNCAPSTYVFTSMGVNPGATISWTVNGQITGQGGVFTHVFGQGGSYNIGMTVTPSGGSPCPTVQKSVSVLSPPTVNIQHNSGAQQVFCSQGSVTLTAQSPTGVAQANWFVNNQNLSGGSITVNFAQSGQYPVTVQIVDTNGCTAVDQDTISVTVVRRVTGNISVQPGISCTPASITLDANLNIPSGANLDSVVWNISGGPGNIKINGPIAAGQLPTTTLSINQGGSYTFGLTAFVGGCSFQIGSVDTIQVDQGATPSIYLVKGSDSICASDQLILQNITANVANLPGSFFWTAPKARPSQSVNPLQVFTFRDTGLFEIKLHYVSLCGDTTVSQYDVYVNGPIARFDMDTIVRRACAPPHTVIFGADPILPVGGTNTYFWEFFDVNNQIMATSTQANPTITYNQVGAYRVHLTITNSLTGCSHTIQDSRLITVGTPASQLAPTGPLAQCAPATFSMSGMNMTPHIPGYIYTWKVYDQQGGLVLTKKGRTPDLEITQPGTYSVKLISQNAQCADSTLAAWTLTVNGVDGRIAPVPAGVCAQGGTYTQAFQVDSLYTYPSSTSVQYEWRVRPSTGTSIVGGNTSQAQVTFTQPGCYKVDVKVTTADSCSTYLKKRNICVGAIADFEMDTPNVCIGGVLELNNTSRVGMGNSATYQWYTIPSGGVFSPSASEKDPSLSFSSPGIYKVGMVYTNKYGCSDTVEYSVNAYHFTGSLIASDTAIDCGPTLIHVRANTPFASNYTWNLQGFQTNYTLQTQAPNDSISWYVSSGTYIVSCVAESSTGCTDSSWVRIKVGGPRPRFFTTTQSTGCEPLTVAFQDTSSNVDSVLFQFGDGSPSMTLGNYPLGGSFTHTFNYPYSSSTADSVVYNPTLVVMSDDCPNPISLTQRVVVYPNPRIAYSLPTKQDCSPFTLVLDDQSTHQGQGAWYVLDYGDGNRDSLNSGQFNHTYQSPGKYILKYRIHTKKGCAKDSILTDTIEVFARPQAGFQTSPDTACFSGNLIGFNDNSLPLNSGGIASYKWYFGDPSSTQDTSTSPNPTWSYGVPGTFDVSLVVTSVNGCSDSIFKAGAVSILDTLPPDNQDLVVISVNQADVLIRWNPSTSVKFGSYNVYREGIMGTQRIITQTNRSVVQGTDPSGQALFGPVSYRMDVEDRCTGVEVEGTLHRTIFLQGTSPSQGEISIFWTPYIGWNGVGEYRILLSSESDPHSFVAKTVSGTDTSTTIQGLCNQLYHVTVVALHPSDPTIMSYSNKVSMSPQYKFPELGPEMQRVTVVEDRTVEVYWEESTFARTAGYIIERKVDNGPWQTHYGYATQSPFIDQQVDVDASTYSYRVRLEDQCGNVSDTSRFGRSILLTVTSDEIEGMKLSWTPYAHWPEGVDHYDVYKVFTDGSREKIGQTPTPTLELTDNTSPGNGNGDACYQVEAFRAFSSDKSTSNIGCAIFPQRLYIPSAFSPNNDGINDVFTLVGIAFESFDFKVFDRWGNMVYNSGSATIEWDGTDLGGQPLPVGSYAYKLVARGTERGYIEKEGTITILR